MIPNTEKDGQLTVRVNKANRFKFKYLCDSRGSSMCQEINKFIVQYIVEDKEPTTDQTLNGEQEDGNV